MKEKQKQKVSTKAAGTGFTVKFISDFLAVRLLFFILSIPFLLVFMRKATAISLITIIMEVLLASSAFLSAKLTIKWAKKNLEIYGDGKISTGANLFMYVVAGISLVNCVVELFTLGVQINTLITIALLVLEVITVIVTVKYFSYYEEQNIVRGQEIQSGSVKRIGFDWFFAIITVIVLAFNAFSTILNIVKIL